MKLEDLIHQIKSDPESIEFKTVIELIDENYDYTATKFRNGPDNNYILNKAGENEGSCKIFAFSLLHELDVEQTLNCFGHYYREDVLNHPDGTDHNNIRTFMKYGWKDITFDSPALRKKNF